MVSSSTEPKFGPLDSSSSHNATLPGTAKGITVIPLASPSLYSRFIGSSNFIGFRLTNFGLRTLKIELFSRTLKTLSVPYKLKLCDSLRLINPAV